VGGLALVLALVALIVTGYGGWRLWRMQQGGQRDSQARAKIHDQFLQLKSSLADQARENQSLKQQLTDAQQHGQALQAQLQSLSERSRSLENTVAGLTARAESGHDAIRLDEAAMLLQLADERYALFHDGDGALRAYAMADKLLAQVEDPAYTAVRQTIATERKALAATHPGQRHGDLDTLSRLREAVDDLPLKTVAAVGEGTGKGFWSRVRKAFSGLVQVRREDAFTPTRRALARQLVALDLARAQAALLAWDVDAYRKALVRADQRLGHDFDTQAAAVRDVRAQIARLGSQSIPPAPQLGAALEELNNLRAVHDAAAPAPAAAAGSTRAPAGAHR
jgi:uroporphyrin-3 C-methyltransferase